MAKWIDSAANKKRNTSVLSKLQESHTQDGKEMAHVYGAAEHRAAGPR